MRGGSHPRHQRRDFVQSSDRVVWGHIGALFGAGNLNPNGGRKISIERPGDVALEAVADHHGAVGGDSEISKEHLEDFGFGFPHPALAGNGDGIEIRA
jgi:hypothetical protein